MIGRPDILVVARLLEALAVAPGPLLRTPLQQKAGLNYTVFSRYLDFLLRQGLVAAAPDGDERLALTPKGLDAYRFLAEGLGRVLGPTEGGPAERRAPP